MYLQRESSELDWTVVLPAQLLNLPVTGELGSLQVLPVSGELGSLQVLPVSGELGSLQVLQPLLRREWGRPLRSRPKNGQFRLLMILKYLFFTDKNVFINDRTKTFHRKNPYFNILHLISIIMGGSLPKFQDT